MRFISPCKNRVTGAVEVAEAALVRDILYVFQGIDGRNVKMSNADNCYKVEGKVQSLKPRLKCSEVKTDGIRTRQARLVCEAVLGSRGLACRFGSPGQPAPRNPGLRPGLILSALPPFLLWRWCPSYLTARYPGIFASVFQNLPFPQSFLLTLCPFATPSRVVRPLMPQTVPATPAPRPVTPGAAGRKPHTCSELSYFSACSVTLLVP